MRMQQELFSLLESIGRVKRILKEAEGPYFLAVSAQ